MSGSASVVALSLVLSFAAYPAWADGGGGSAGGSAPGEAGQPGTDGTDNGGGGGGGGGAHGFVGATLPTLDTTGGGGGNGGSANAFDGGGGGAGGYGAVVTGNGNLGLLDNALNGGNGGAGGNAGSSSSSIAYAGNGGSGGVGLRLNDPGAKSITIGADVQGGEGGDSGTAPSGSVSKSKGGAGGEGISANNATIEILSGVTVSGGDGGDRDPNDSSGDANYGLGGAGIRGSDLAIIVNGAVSGGMSGDGVTQADAIELLGGGNRLELWSTSAINGNVAASGSNNTLALGGAGTATFNVTSVGATAQYQGFTDFEKTGTGTWALTGTTTEATPWTLKQGTLSVSSDANLGAASGKLTFNGGRLLTTGTFTLTKDANITTGATGTFAAAGGTTLTLRNTSPGQFSIQSGATLRFGSVGDGDGTIVLELSTTNATPADGQVFIDAGTLRLGSGISRYIFGGNGAPVHINAGAVFDINGQNDVRVDHLGDGADGGGSITNGGSTDRSIHLRNDIFDTAFSGAIEDGVNATLGVIKEGNATLALNGINTYTGLTTVNGGKLVVGDAAHPGASVAGDVGVESGGTLGGIGTVGNTTVGSGATLAPGNLIGTIHVGNVTFDAGSIYSVEVDAAGNADKTESSGTATINGGTVDVTAGAGSYAPSTQYAILTAQGGLAGDKQFDGVTSNLAFLDPSLTYDASNVYLTMTRNDIDFAGLGITRNEQAAGAGVESLGFGSPVYDAVLNLSAPQARAAFDNLSGEIHASAKTALVEESHFLRDAVNERIRSAFAGVGAAAAPVLAYGETGMDNGATAVISHALAPADTGRLAAWGSAFGSWGGTDGDGNAARLDRSTGGFLTGIDGLVADNVRLGIMTGYSHSNFDVNGRASSGSSDNYHLGLYGGTQMDALGLRAGVAYTWHDVSTSRSVAFPNFADSLSADYDAGTFQAFGEAGYRIDTASASFEPFANLAYVSLHTDGFTEKGGAAALTSAGQTTDATFTTLGVRASTSFDLGAMKATARGMVGWRHAFGDTTPLATHAFAGGNAFTVAGVPIAKDAAIVEAGLDFVISDNATLGVSYSGQFGSHATDNGARANLSVRF